MANLLPAGRRRGVGWTGAHVGSSALPGGRGFRLAGCRRETSGAGPGFPKE